MSLPGDAKANPVIVIPCCAANSSNRAASERTCASGGGRQMRWLHSAGLKIPLYRERRASRGTIAKGASLKLASKLKPLCRFGSYRI